jgi:hypothetical protein
MTFEEHWNKVLSGNPEIPIFARSLAEAAWAAATTGEREACASLCEEVVEHPAGYGGQWEGYGPVKKPREGNACAAAIRKRSNLTERFGVNE